MEPWKRTELINEEINHDFPLPHKDMLFQTVNLQVPPDKFDEIAAFDGSLVINRTRGEIAAFCDKEPATEKLIFQPPQNAGFSDQPIIEPTAAQKEQMKKMGAVRQ